MAATKPNFVSAKKSFRKFLAEINSSDEKKERKRGVKKNGMTLSGLLRIKARECGFCTRNLMAQMKISFGKFSCIVIDIELAIRCDRRCY